MAYEYNKNTPLEEQTPKQCKITYHKSKPLMAEIQIKQINEKMSATTFK
jgi:hypothetical protein